MRSPLRPTALSLGLLLAALGALACGGSAEGEASSSAHAQGGATAGSSSEPGARAAMPPRTAHEATTAERLGVLPEGVGLAAGTAAPSLTLHDFRGQEVALADRFAAGPTLLIFYRGGWCPYCNYQIFSLTERWSDFERRGVTPVLISVDRVEAAGRTQSAYQIPFPVLVDPQAAALAAYRVAHHVEQEELEAYEGYGIDLEEASGEDHHNIAIPSIFLVDRSGTIRWAHADPEINIRPTVDQILSVLDELGFGEGASSAE